jgi:hypothetical protein
MVWGTARVWSTAGIWTTSSNRCRYTTYDDDANERCPREYDMSVLSEPDNNQHISGDWYHDLGCLLSSLSHWVSHDITL